MRTLVVVLVLASALAATTLAFPQEGEVVGVGGSDFHKNDITYSMEVVTPHVKWATTLPGGPIKGFFIPSVQFGRDMVELMQRLELQPTTVSIDRDWDVNCWGIGDYYSHRDRGDRDDFQIVYGYVEQDLTGPADFEVMVIPGLHGWSRLTRASRDAILRRVSEGAGLVLLHPFVGDPRQRPFEGDEPEPDLRIWEISPLVDCLDDDYDEGGYPQRPPEALADGKWEVVRKHFITDGVPLELLPEALVGGQFYRYRANGEVLVKSGQHPIIATKTYGRGRVVALAYVDDGFIPPPAEPAATGIYWDYWEYQYSLLARCIVWAAGREGGTSLSASVVGAGDAAHVALRLEAESAGAVAVEVSGRSEYGQSLETYRARHRVRPGENTIEIPLSALRPAVGWPGGRQLLNIIIREADAAATLDWAAATFTMPQRAQVTDLGTDAAVYQSGGILHATVRCSGDLEELRLRFSIADDMGRLLMSKVEQAAAEVGFSYELAEFLGKYAYATADLVTEGGAIVDQLRAAPVPVVQAERRAREYVAQVSFGGGRHYFRDVRRRLVRAAGAEMGFTWGGDVNNSLDVPTGTFGTYWYHRGPTTEEGIEAAIAEYEASGDVSTLAYNTKRALYERTGDTKFLARAPCFHDPDFMNHLTTTVGEAARQKAIYNFDYYFVGDEGSLTSYGDALDFCWGEHTLSTFREWLITEYQSLDALNREWRTDYADWESVLPYTTAEAQQTGRFAPWADHRTFMEITFADAYRHVREAVAAGDPEGHIAVSGTQATNAYNGCDWYRLDQVIDDFLSYGGGNQWDLHRSFAKPGAMIGFWTGYGSRGIGVQNAIWTAAIHNVLYPNIFWMYSYLDPDFTYSDSARDMGEAFKALKHEGIGKLIMESERLHDGIAIHFSMPSVHAATITGNHSQRRRGEEARGRSFPGNRDGWVRVVKDLGMQFEFASSEQVEQGILSTGEYRVLILPMSMALSREEVEAIRGFVAAGGVVIADAGAGAMDEHCSWSDHGLLDDLFGISTAPSAERAFADVAGEIAVTSEGAIWGLKQEDVADIQAVERVAAAGGTALLKAGETDAIIVRRLGRGWAIYLNVLLDGYSRARRRDYGGAGYRALVGALLERVGISPGVRVVEADGSPLRHAIIARYQLGSSYVLAVVKENVGVEGRDGVTYYDDSQLGTIARQQVTVQLPTRYQVVDARTGERFGHTDTVTTSITVGGALILGLSPSQNEIEVTGPTSASLGEHPTFTIRSSSPEEALVRCHFTGPDGTSIPYYAKNVLVAGTGAVTLPSALNDPAGEYRLEATDVLSGATAVRSIRLE